jgi:hypothetical protein
MRRHPACGLTPLVGRVPSDIWVTKRILVGWSGSEVLSSLNFAAALSLNDDLWVPQTRAGVQKRRLRSLSVVTQLFGVLTDEEAEVSRSLLRTRINGDGRPIGRPRPREHTDPFLRRLPSTGLRWSRWLRSERRRRCVGAVAPGTRRTCSGSALLGPMCRGWGGVLVLGGARRRSRPIAGWSWVLVARVSGSLRRKRVGSGGTVAFTR